MDGDKPNTNKTQTRERRWMAADFGLDVCGSCVVGDLHQQILALLEDTETGMIHSIHTDTDTQTYHHMSL